MKAAENQLLSFLDGRKQFVIPIYQRTYSWTREQCEQLWNDIIHAATDAEVKDHFIGSVVYIQNGITVIARTPQFLVIDGQQRLTTLSLLLAALAKAVQSKPTPGVTYDEIHETYLVNKHGRDEDHYKLILTRADKETLTALVDDKELPSHPSPRLVENYRYLEEQIRKSGLSEEAIYSGLQKLIIVDISLDRSHDNPQLIFESLNSTGLELSQADLIRNYVLMGVDVDYQTRLYEDYWFRMEQNFGDNYGDYFDYFMRDYLTLKSKSGTIPKIGEVYVEFKKYRQSRADVSIADIIADVYRYSRYYTRLAFICDPDAEVNQAARDIKTLEVDVAFPFFLELYDDYRQERLSRADFLAILRLVESYVFRRAICDIPTNSMNKTFATLSREIDKDHYLESVQAVLLLKDSYRRFPSDDEFQRMFKTRNIYDLSKRRQYLLGKLENFDHKEPMNVKGYTIEHIMPQNEQLLPDWQAMLGPDWQQIQSRYLHTIGNLTLTGYNSELSDRPFIEKRDMKGGFRDSHMRLNADLAQLDRWDQSEIERRADRLAGLAVRIWPAPHLSQQALSKYMTTPRKRRQKYEPVDIEELLEYISLPGTFLSTVSVAADPTDDEE